MTRTRRKKRQPTAKEDAAQQEQQAIDSPQPTQFRPGPCKYCGKMGTRVTNTWRFPAFIMRRVHCRDCGRAEKRNYYESE